MRTRHLFVLLICFPVTLFAIGCAQDKKGQKPGSQFESLRVEVLQGKHKETIPKLESFIEKHPKSKQASRAGLFLFKCNFALNDLEAARKWCTWTIEKHPTSLEAQKCRFKLAMIQLVDGNVEQAKSAFKKLAASSSVPLSPEAKRMALFLEEFEISKKK